MKKLIISLAATLALSSCGIYSKYKSATEVPDGLYGQEGVNPSASASNLGSLPWQEVFTDPCLRTLIDTALVRNTDLRTAHLRVKEAEATLLSARLSYLPAFSLSPQGTARSLANLLTARQRQLGDRHLRPADERQAACTSCRGAEP